MKKRSAAGVGVAIILAAVSLATVPFAPVALACVAAVAFRFGPISRYPWAHALRRLLPAFAFLSFVFQVTLCDNPLRDWGSVWWYNLTAGVGLAAAAVFVGTMLALVVRDQTPILLAALGIGVSRRRSGQGDTKGNDP